MKRIEMLAAAIGLALLLMSCGDDDGDSGSNDAGIDTDSESWDPRFDAFVAALKADLAASNAYGVSAAVMENGVMTFAEAFGSKDTDGLDPLTPHTLMQIGSTTKQMTATALLKKVEAGEVALDDTLEEVLPKLEFALDGTWDDEITLHHLLSHQGAFVDWIPWDGLADDAELANYTYGTFDESYYLMNPPGLFYNYSNPNFVFAGLITETLDARRWPEIMREDVFGPLGMERTFLRKTEAEADGDYALSYGYGINNLESEQMEPVSMEDMPDPAWGRPAGAETWTTPTQMMAWAKFIIDGNPIVLADALRNEITTEQVDTLYGAGSVHYGYGMLVESGYLARDGKWYATPVWEHGGNTLSFSNIFYILPEQSFAVAITSSAYGTNFSTSLDTAITTLAVLPAPSEGPEYTIDYAEFDDHVGTYNDSYNVGEVIITRDGNTLLIDLPAITQYGYEVTPQLEAISSDIFLVYIDGEPLDITFIRTEPDGLSKYIRNRQYVATRIEDEPDAGTAEVRAIPSREAVERWMMRARLEPNSVRPIPD